MGNPIEKAMKKTMKKMIDPIMKPINKMMGFFGKIMKFFAMVKLYIDCAIKLIKNFYKCFIFYWLDIIKYTFVYLPILCLMGILGLSKEWKPIQATLDKLIGWPNNIQNDCYRCKTKKGKSLLESIQKMLDDILKGEQGDSHFSFLSFMIVVGLGCIAIYMIWFTLRSKK